VGEWQAHGDLAYTFAEGAMARPVLADPQELANQTAFEKVVRMLNGTARGLRAHARHKANVSGGGGGEPSAQPRASAAGRSSIHLTPKAEVDVAVVPLSKSRGFSRLEGLAYKRQMCGKPAAQQRIVHLPSFPEARAPPLGARASAHQPEGLLDRFGDRPDRPIVVESPARGSWRPCWGGGVRLMGRPPAHEIPAADAAHAAITCHPPCDRTTYATPDWDQLQELVIRDDAGGRFISRIPPSHHRRRRAMVGDIDEMQTVGPANEHAGAS